MNNMKQFLTLFVLSLAFLMPAPAFAALDVVFESTPLFTVSDFVPGDTEEGDITISNTGSDSEEAYTEAVNISDPDGLGSQMRLRVLEGTTVLYDDVFSTFLASGKVALSTISGASASTYTFEVSFISSTDDTYQGKSLGFDLCVGFSGGQFECGDTVVGPEIETPPGGGGGGGGSGGGGGGGPISITPLAIFNERVVEVTIGSVDVQNGTAVIAWNTNFLATSQIIYGLKSSGPYSLNLTVTPYFGYPMGTVEDSTKVTDHEMTITNLVPGETYLFRVVSRASPPTVSFEHEFALVVPSVGGPGTPPAPETPGEGGTPSGPGGSGGGGGTGGGSGTTTGTTTGGLSADENSLAAAAFLGIPAEFFGFLNGFSFECVLLLLLILVLIYAVWAGLEKAFSWSDIPSAERTRRRALSFFLMLLVATVIAVVVGRDCIVIPLAVLVVISAVWLLVLIVRSTPNENDTTPPKSDLDV